MAKLSRKRAFAAALAALVCVNPAKADSDLPLPPPQVSPLACNYTLPIPALYGGGVAQVTVFTDSVQLPFAQMHFGDAAILKINPLFPSQNRLDVIRADGQITQHDPVLDPYANSLRPQIRKMLDKCETLQTLRGFK